MTRHTKNDQMTSNNILCSGLGAMKPGHCFKTWTVWVYPGQVATLRSSPAVEDLCCQL